MLYRQKFDTFIRRYGDVGYITNKSDFGDRVVDASGAVFLDALSRKGQSLDALTAKIAASFVGVDMAALKKDAAEFYAMLEQDGFIVSGETEAELDAKEGRGSTANIRILSGVFLIVLIVEHLIFSIAPFRLAPYIIITGVIMLLYALIAYAVSRALR
jgi:hypothetical protein